MRSDAKFRKHLAPLVIEEVCKGRPCYEVYEELSEGDHVSKGGSVRNLVSIYAREHPQFDAAMVCAKYARKIKDLAEELDSPELRDLQGFAESVAKRLVEEWSNGRATK